MPLQPKLNRFTTAAPILAVFDSQDFASGLNRKAFFGMTSSLAAGTEYILSDTVELSADPVETRTSPGTTTLTFNTSPFNLVRTVKGDTIFTVGVGVSGTNTVGLTVQMKKVTDAGVTDISSVITSSIFSFPGGDVDTEFLLRIPTTETIINEGDKIRLVVEFITTPSNNTTEMGTDPSGRDGTITFTEGTTVMKLNVAFKIE